MNNKDNELRARKDFGVTESKKREYPPLPEKLTTTTVDAHCHLDIEDEDIFMSVEDSLAKAKAVGITGIVQVGVDVPSSRWAVKSAKEFSQIFSIWQKQSALKTSASTRMVPRRWGADYSAPRLPYISSDFGWRRDPITKELRMHKGLDMPGALGSPIYATANGVVREAKWRGSYGFLVEIEHSKSVRTRYAHLSRINVVPRQRVRRNDIIGLMGTTGRSTGSHLHYEIFIDGIAVDPKPSLAASP